MAELQAGGLFITSTSTDLERLPPLLKVSQQEEENKPARDEI